MNLKTIRLRKNQSAFPREILFDSDITHLEIFAENLNEFPKEALVLRNLQSLTFKVKHFEKFPQFLSQFSELQILKFIECENTEIIDLKDLHRLKTLFIQKSHLTETSPEWWLFPELEVCDLSGNRIEALPSLDRIPQKLKRLNLDRNQLKNLPDWIFQMQQLRHISLDYNPLSKEESQRLFDQFKVWFQIS